MSIWYAYSGIGTVLLAVVGIGEYFHKKEMDKISEDYEHEYMLHEFAKAQKKHKTLFQKLKERQNIYFFACFLMSYAAIALYLSI